eukprot:TRINITY_DN6697_c0_g1_i5.p2 TRINITY_DN6697_c0_g1~~TRINITY_DN6697_c0_g1_i5.p2  ORF type:complete len:132 (+),score=42.17 TRINITY_DN6697_c0_g1_i5:141-536(+)
MLRSLVGSEMCIRDRSEYVAAYGEDGRPDSGVTAADREFGLVDTNKDEGISRSEFENAYGPESGAEFDRVDTNKDGSISKSEYVAAYGEDGRPDLGVTAADREFGLVDTNKDESISRSEFENAYGLESGVV